MITITDRAAEKINETLTSGEAEGEGLRIKVIGGGCSGQWLHRHVRLEEFKGENPHDGDDVEHEDEDERPRQLDVGNVRLPVAFMR